jgi:metal-responsive CopG/Arc/MetJ family transcriptional regulator
MADDVTISIKVPTGMLLEIEQLVEEQNFQNRSELIRTAIRGYIQSQRQRPADPGDAPKSGVGMGRS